MDTEIRNTEYSSSRRESQKEVGLLPNKSEEEISEKMLKFSNDITYFLMFLCMLFILILISTINCLRNTKKELKSSIEEVKILLEALQTKQTKHFAVT
ncbi:hypothetical protein MOUN0_O03818 [Monosporozyma unispora]